MPLLRLHFNSFCRASSNLVCQPTLWKNWVSAPPMARRPRGVLSIERMCVSMHVRVWGLWVIGEVDSSQCSRQSHLRALLSHPHAQVHTTRKFSHLTLGAHFIPPTPEEYGSRTVSRNPRSLLRRANRGSGMWVRFAVAVWWNTSVYLTTQFDAKCSEVMV